MANEIKVFQNTEFGELGVLMIDGKEFFPATHCARILGYSNPHDALIRHCKGDGIVKREGVSYTTNQHGVTTRQITEIKYINEGNLYRLIVSSKLPAAEKFEHWVFDEVLPTIRKTGSYSTPKVKTCSEPINVVFNKQLAIMEKLSKVTGMPAHDAAMASLIATERITGEDCTAFKNFLIEGINRKAARQSISPVSVCDFFLEFQDKWVWDFVPMDFLYDLYVSWYSELTQEI